jgi:hypothetical protein
MTAPYVSAARRYRPSVRRSFQRHSDRSASAGFAAHLRGRNHVRTGRLPTCTAWCHRKAVGTETFRCYSGTSRRAQWPEHGGL